MIHGRETRAENGFSLLEILVAIGLTGLLAVAVFTVFFGSQRAAGGLNRVIENRQNSRTALQLIERDVRMAGSGWGRVIVDGCYDTNRLRLSPLTPWHGGSPLSSDSLGMIGAWDLSTSLSTLMPNATSTIKVKSAAGFTVNDYIVVAHEGTAHLFQITGITGTDITHATTSKYNVACPFNFPAAGYPKNARVYRVTFVSYKIDSTGSKPRLMRWQTGQTPQVVANNVQQFKLNYFLQDGTVTRAPVDLTTIERVEPVIITVASGAGLSQAIPDSAWASIKPRTF